MKPQAHILKEKEIPSTTFENEKSPAPLVQRRLVTRPSVPWLQQEGLPSPCQGYFSCCCSRYSCCCCSLCSSCCCYRYSWCCCWMHHEGFVSQCQGSYCCWCHFIALLSILSMSIISDNQSVCSSCWNKPYPIYEVVTILRCLHLKQVCLIHLFSVINTATWSVLEFRVLHITLHHTGESIAYLKKIQ